MPIDFTGHQRRDALTLEAVSRVQSLASVTVALCDVPHITLATQQLQELRYIAEDVGEVRVQRVFCTLSGPDLSAVTELLIRRARRATTAQALLAWLRLAFPGQEETCWIWAVHNTAGLPVIGEIQPDKWIVMPWHRVGVAEMYSQTVMSGGYVSKATYLRLATAFWLHFDYLPDELEEPSEEVWAALPVVLAHKQQEKARQAQTEREAEEKRVWLAERLPRYLVESQHGSLWALGGTVGPFRVSVYELPDGRLFSCQEANGKEVQLVVRSRLLWITDGFSWQDVTASSDERFRRLFDQASTPVEQVHILPLGQRLIEEIADLGFVGD